MYATTSSRRPEAFPNFGDMSGFDSGKYSQVFELYSRTVKVVIVKASKPRDYHKPGLAPGCCSRFRLQSACRDSLGTVQTALRIRVIRGSLSARKLIYRT